jgi:hypothetical protein
VKEERRYIVRAVLIWKKPSGVEVKVCCEGKELNHCGECPDFPCTMLAEMGKDQGYDPEPRLTQCRKWAEEGHV